MSKNFTVIVSQMRVLGQKNWRGGAKRPAPAFIGLITKKIDSQNVTTQMVDFERRLCNQTQ